jgi:chromosome partitioning protein
MIISVVNQKGGVGKTTTAINLATALAACVGSVLVVDLDPQGNTSTGLGVDHDSRHHTIYDVFHGAPIQEVITRTDVPGLDLISANIDLVAAELEIIGRPRREFILGSAISLIKEKYKYIMIDCPPSLGLLTINALAASSKVLIPMQCEFYSLEGLSHLLKTIELVRTKLNPSLEICGILLTMYDKRNRLTEHIEQDVRSYMKHSVFKTVIPRNIRISEAPSHGTPVMLYDHKCPGSLAYMYLAKEILEMYEKS